jgi:hypothetical protein
VTAKLGIRKWKLENGNWKIERRKKKEERRKKKEERTALGWAALERGGFS